MIISFSCKETEKIFKNEFSRKIPHDIQKRACNKLVILNAASSEKDLIVPYSNNFEHLSGEFKEYCSIRINDQFRIVFKFDNGNAYEVYITDYH